MKKNLKTISYMVLCSAAMLCSVLISSCASSPPEPQTEEEEIPFIEPEDPPPPVAAPPASAVHKDDSNDRTPEPAVSEPAIPDAAAVLNEEEKEAALAEEEPAPPQEPEQQLGEKENVGLVVESTRPVTGIIAEYVPVEVLPEIIFKGRGVKVEAEQMLLTDCSVEKDFLASGAYGVLLGDNSSRAEFAITLPSGSYECLVSEKAFDTEESAFYVLLNDKPYRVYPSNPPLGSWELTIRTPIQIELEEETRLSVSLQTHNGSGEGETGMQVDYIQFVRLD